MRLQEKEKNITPKKKAFGIKVIDAAFWASLRFSSLSVFPS